MIEETLSDLAKTRTNVKKLLESIDSRISKIKKLQTEEKKETEELDIVGLISANYDFSLSATRWVTCAQVCKEIGVETNRRNTSLVGMALCSISVPSKRSNGLSLRRMPDAKRG